MSTTIKALPNPVIMEKMQITILEIQEYQTDFYHHINISQKLPAIFQQPIACCCVLLALMSIFYGASKCLDPRGSAHFVSHDSRDTEELDPGCHEERQTLHRP